MRKYPKPSCENVKNMTLFCGPRVTVTILLCFSFNCNRFKQIVYFSAFWKYDCFSCILCTSCVVPIYTWDASLGHPIYAETMNTLKQGGLRSMPNLAIILQSKALKNCPRSPDLENTVKNTFSTIYDSFFVTV